ncbi:MAG TPA: DUF1653 domain-containing protein [Clostridiales bacterium]|nr:DUF1653 domain-containing protein [Clostridiales bacterium]
MEINMDKTPRPGEIFNLTKDKPYQIITLAIHKETNESMVVYQVLYGDFATFVLPLEKFLKVLKEEGSDIPTYAISDKESPDTDLSSLSVDEHAEEVASTALYNVENNTEIEDFESQNKVNHVLLSFLDADSYGEKLDVITTHIKAMDDRLINDMAASLDCTVDEGPMDKRLQELIYCLKQLSRFEVRR